VNTQQKQEQNEENGPGKWREAVSDVNFSGWLMNGQGISLDVVTTVGVHGQNRAKRGRKKVKVEGDFPIGHSITLQSPKFAPIHVVAFRFLQ
jgi:hypothetical protein